MLKVRDKTHFQHFDYVSEPCDYVELGAVVKKIDEDNCIEVGVVIQTFSDGTIRTDMFGIAHFSDIEVASINDIWLYRKDILAHLEDSNEQ